MSSLKGKIGLVTGGGKGIGKAIALALAREGVDVAILDIDLTSAEATAAEIGALGPRSMAVQCDVSVWEEVKKSVARVVREWGGIDILINNAGLGTLAMMEDMEKSEWDHVMGVNLNGVFHCSRAAIETMKKRGGGNIINISSLAGKRIALMQGAHYTASKAGILGFTRHLAYELGPFNIRVNAICPGTVVTPFVETWAMPEFREKLKKMIPLQRLGTPEDIADVAVFLVSDKARMVTGIEITVDGGQSVALLDWDTYLKSRKER